MDNTAPSGDVPPNFSGSDDSSSSGGAEGAGECERKGIDGDDAGTGGRPSRVEAVSLPMPLPRESSAVLSLSGGGASTGPGKRRLRPWTAAQWGEEGDAGGQNSVKIAGGGSGGAGISGGGLGERQRGIELPPCPVCFDRLDPSVSGVPTFRRRVRAGGPAATAAAAGSGTARTLGNGLRDLGERCRHRACRGKDNGNGGGGIAETSGVSTQTERGADNATARGATDGTALSRTAGEGMGSGSIDVEMGALDVRGGESLNASMSGEGASAPWCGSGRDGRVGAGGGDGDGAGMALYNEFMWRGSNCRVCRSLNVALEGAPEVVSTRDGVDSGSR